MIRCSVCRHEEYEGTIFCSECGNQLWLAPPPANTTGFVSTRTLRLRSDRLRESNGTEPGLTERPVIAPRQIVLRIHGSSEVVTLGDQPESRLGRGDPSQENKPDVDLTQFRARQLGVSRLHAAIRRDGPELNVVDLGSANGTLLNGVRLPPHVPHRLRDGDELRLGGLSMRVFFQSESNKE